mgnify:CR=1 FL=1
MLDVEKLRKENEQARQEISEYYEKNSIKNQIKEWIAKHDFFSKLANTNIFGLFWPNYDNKEYGNGDSILQYVLYCIFNFFITVSILKIGFDFNVFPVVLGIVLVIQIFLNIKLFCWQAVITNFVVFFCSLWLVTSRVNNAMINTTYHNIEMTDTLTTNDFFIEQSKINQLTKYINNN